MSIPLRVALVFASLFIILKLLLFNLGKHEDLYMVVVFANIFCILLAMVFGIRAWKKIHPERREYSEDVKVTMKAAGMYVLMVSSFAYLYYAKIDTGFIETRINERVIMAEKADFEDLKAKNPEKLKDLTREDFIDAERENAELWFSPFFMSTLMLVAGLLISFFYSLVIAWFWRKFMDAVPSASK